MTLYGYDTISRLNSLSYKYNGIYEHEYTTSYIADNRITSFKLSSGQNDIFTVNPVFDGLGRQTARTLKNGSGAQVDKEAYSFVTGAGGANASTSMIASVGYYGSDSTVDETYTYTYDNIGNIKTVSKNGTQIASYTYNSLNELTSYTDAAGTVHTYEYSDGNRLQYNERTALLYEDDVWLDRVTTIIDAETYDDFAVTYDAIGNPLTYRDGMSFTWKNGRQLATYTQGQTSASYNYNESGIRTDKTVNGITTTYQLDGSKIVSENRNGNIIQYYYDETNSVIGLRYNGNDYFFRRNIQTDIISILNSSGTVVVSYEYDPWGNILSVTGSMASTLGVANPFRYRSYYYDTESGLYYLNSRYYDAKVCRFVNADSYVSTGQGFLGYDMYAYCLNNPVSYSDPAGNVCVRNIVTSDKEGAVINQSFVNLPGYRPQMQKPTASFESNGDVVNVYIVSADRCSFVEKNISERDVVIVDKRNETIPDIQWRNSYITRSRNETRKILAVIAKYARENPIADVQWDRTVSSMETELRYHNWGYIIATNSNNPNQNLIERAKHVDFDNSEDGTNPFFYLGVLLNG